KWMRMVKMADINKRLLTSSDGIPAPQHKVKGESDFEFTEGSGGAQHTKIVDASGQPADIDAELKSIKRTQAEIWVRLDKVIDTRLTGSIVEFYNDIEIVSGELFNTDFFNVYNANTIIVTLSDRGNIRVRDELELRAAYRRGDNGGRYVFAEVIEQTQGSGPGYGKLVFDLLTPHCRLEFRNQSVHAGNNLQINVYGVVR